MTLKKLSNFRHYIGDVNLEYGGTFFDLSEWKHGYVDALRVTDLDSGCGFEGAVMVERIMILVDNAKEVKSAFRCCDMSHAKMHGMTAEQRKLWIADAVVSYGYYDVTEDFGGSHRWIFQTSDGPMSFDGWKAEKRIRGDLYSYLYRHGYLREFC